MNFGRPFEMSLLQACFKAPAPLQHFPGAQNQIIQSDSLSYRL